MLREQNHGCFILFHAVEYPDQSLFWGQPVDDTQDVGLSLAKKQAVKVRVWDMVNPEDGDTQPTGEILTVKMLFCPLDSARQKARETQQATVVSQCEVVCLVHYNLTRMALLRISSC